MTVGHSSFKPQMLPFAPAMPRQLGQYEPAIRELVRAIALKPDDRTAQINLAVAYEQTGDHLKSLALFRSLDSNARSPLPSTVVIFISGPWLPLIEPILL